MTLRFDIMRGQRLVLSKVFQDEQDFSVMCWGHAEQKQDFVHASYFRTRRISAARPSVRLAFHQYRRIVTAEVEFVRFLNTDSDWDGESRLKRDASFRKE
jgi:hypothetical protein